MRLAFSFNVTKAAAFAAASLFLAAPANAFSGGFDGGGRVLDYLDQVSAANAGGYRVEIAGTCASACTMKLGARNACVYRSAELLFHAAHDDYGRVNSLGTRILMRQYPAAIRSWVVRHNAVASTALTSMSGAQAIALGVQDCEHPRATVAQHRSYRHHYAHHRARHHHRFAHRRYRFALGDN